MRDLKTLSWLVAAVFALSFNLIGETHSSEKEKSFQGRPQADSSEKTEKKLFDESPGDLDETERKEIEAICREVLSAVEQEKSGKGNLGEILDWDKKQDRIQKTLKKFQSRLDKENASSDSRAAKKELESVLEKVQEKKNRAWRKWVNPFSH